MKKIIIIAVLLLAGAAEVKAADRFGAEWKPKPSITLFGQKISWALPSVCIGAKAGVLPDAGVSPDGVILKVPYFSVDLPFPSLNFSLGKGKTEVEVKVGAINKTKHEQKD